MVAICEEVVLADSDILGTAVAVVPSGYSGPCTVRLEGSCSGSALIGFPSYEQAKSAACFAVGVLGGYFYALVEPATSDQVTHQNWEDWALV